MKFRLLKKDIPVYCIQSGEFVRYLTSEDLDGDLYQDLIHDNVEKIIINEKNKLRYSTKGMLYTFNEIKPGRNYRTGFQGNYCPCDSELESMNYDLECFATWIAIGIASYIEKEGIYKTYFSNARWKVVASEKESDRHATIQTKEGSRTFYFKRIWDNEERKDIAEIL